MYASAMVDSFWIRCEIDNGMKFKKQSCDVQTQWLGLSIHHSRASSLVYVAAPLPRRAARNSKSESSARSRSHCSEDSRSSTIALFQKQKPQITLSQRQQLLFCFISIVIAATTIIRTTALFVVAWIKVGSIVSVILSSSVFCLLASAGLCDTWLLYEMEIQLISEDDRDIKHWTYRLVNKGTVAQLTSNLLHWQEWYVLQESSACLCFNLR